MTLELPEMLDIPPKLFPIITEFNKYRYFVLDGGRGSAKSTSVALLILYLCSVRKVRVMCLREVQNSIEESVYQLLVDLIFKYKLDFEVHKSEIRNRVTDSTIRFRGCREQDAMALKSLEGIDIVWGEEAQSISQASLDILIPTIRKNTSKLFFTMNRHVRNDPVFETLVGRDDCLNITVQYFDNKYCPQVLKDEAAQCKLNSERDYRHIWLGEPLESTSEHLFNSSKLAKMPEIEATGDLFIKQRAIGIDFAGGGGDLCVASVIERRSVTHWELIDQIAWSNPDTDESVGKSIAIFGQYRPDVFVVDKGGLGYPMFVSLSKAVGTTIGFDGASTDNKPPTAGNNRAGGYLKLREFVDNEWLICKSKLTIKQLETIMVKYRPSGDILIRSKQDMKADSIESPDRADSLMMAVWGVVFFLGKQMLADSTNTITRVNVRKNIDSVAKLYARKSGRK